MWPARAARTPNRLQHRRQRRRGRRVTRAAGRVRSRGRPPQGQRSALTATTKRMSTPGRRTAVARGGWVVRRCRRMSGKMERSALEPWRRRPCPVPSQSPAARGRGQSQAGAGGSGGVRAAATLTRMRCLPPLAGAGARSSGTLFPSRSICSVFSVNRRQWMSPGEAWREDLHNRFGSPTKICPQDSFIYGKHRILCSDLVHERGTRRVPCCAIPYGASHHAKPTQRCYVTVVLDLANKDQVSKLL